MRRAAGSHSRHKAPAVVLAALSTLMAVTGCSAEPLLQPMKYLLPSLSGQLEQPVACSTAGSCKLKFTAGIQPWQQSCFQY